MKTCSTPYFDCRNELYAPDLVRDMTLVGWIFGENSVGPVTAEECHFGLAGVAGGRNGQNAHFLLIITERLLPKYKHDHPVICGQCLGPLEHRKVVWSPVGRLFDQNWPKRARGGLREPSAVTGPTENFEIFPTHKSHVPGQIGCVEFISAVKTRRWASLHGVLRAVQSVNIIGWHGART